MPRTTAHGGLSWHEFARRLPSGRYQARYWYLGQQVAADTTFASKGEARAWLASVETDMRRGEHIAPTDGHTRFGAYAIEWLEHRPLRPRTREVYASQLTYITATFGPLPLADINPHDVRQAPLLRDVGGQARAYLLAMAQDDGPARQRDIASRMGVDASTASTYRTRLIAAETITPGDRGYVDFSVPYLRETIRELIGVDPRIVERSGSDQMTEAPQEGADRRNGREIS